MLITLQNVYLYKEDYKIDNVLYLHNNIRKIKRNRKGKIINENELVGVRYNRNYKDVPITVFLGRHVEVFKYLMNLYLSERKPTLYNMILEIQINKLDQIGFIDIIDIIYVEKVEINNMLLVNVT